MAQGNLLGHSQIQEVISEQMVQLNMQKTAEFDEMRSGYALKSNLDSALRDYIPKSRYEETVVQLDESGRIPRSAFQRVLKTDPSNVYSAITSAANITSGATRNISSITIPSQPTEFYALAFGTFYYVHSDAGNTSHIEVKTSSDMVIGRGSSIQLESGTDKPTRGHSFGITIMPVPSSPLPPGSSHTISMMFETGYHLLWTTAAKPNPWCVICIPKGA